MKAKDIQIVTRRDSATAALRKLGVGKHDYNRFIRPTGDGKFEFHIGEAKKAVGNTDTKVAEKVSPKAGKKTGAEDKPATREHKPRVGSVSATAQALILDGKTNDEVWHALQKKFGLDESKRGYPSWYRSYLRRLGILPHG